MFSVRQIVSPAFPTSTPYDEAKALDVYLSVNQMGMQLYAFEQCVALFEFLSDHAKDAPIDNHEEGFKRAWWRFVPAQQGALAIWHFRKSLDALRTSVNRHRSISSAVDTSAIKAAIEVTFRAKFPDWHELRFGVAHYSEAHFSTERGQAHSAPGPSVFGLEIPLADQLQATAIVNGRFGMTVDGKEVSYAVSQQSVEALRTIYDQVIDALEVPVGA